MRVRQRVVGGRILQQAEVVPQGSKPQAMGNLVQGQRIEAIVAGLVTRLGQL